MEHNSIVDAWLDGVMHAVADSTFVKLVLNQPTETAGDLKSITVRPILVKRQLKLSFTYQHKTRDIVKNFTPDESRILLNNSLEQHFANGRFYTLVADVHVAKKNGQWVMTRHAPSQVAAPELTHDRSKKRWVYSHQPYLHTLGIADAHGHIVKSAQDKFRQINKYIEILDGLIQNVPHDGTLRIVDMGAGKGYLTFALYDYLTQRGTVSVEMIGVESRADLVRQGNAIAKASAFDRLQFVEGTIADYDCTGADIVIALHACDTATDDAIHKAIRAEASLIVVAPCCHKQLRRAMAKPADDHPLAYAMQYGTYTERMAEMLTDSMRAQLMEMHGYKTNLFEFISDAHTPKNVMIVGTQSAQAQNPKKIAALQEALARTQEQFGITYHQLARLLA